MKAAAVVEPGGPDVLRVIEVPTPTPKAGEALVRVEVASVNAADMWTRREGVVSAYPHIPGSDAAGTIVDIHGAAFGLAAGDEVVVNPSFAREDASMLALGRFADVVDILGYNLPGTYCEYITVPVEQVAPKPLSLTMREAGALPLTFLTAWRMLHTRGRVSAGETIFLWGASGGLGTAALQIAVALGTRVIASAGSRPDAERLREIGAADVVLYREGDVAEQVAALTNGRGVDVVFDSVAGPTWRLTLQMLRPGGRVLLAGTTAGDRVEFDLSDVFYYQWALLGCRMGDRRDFAEVLRFVDAKGVKPVVAESYRLDRASDAHSRFEAGDFVGKLVLEVG